MDETKDSEFFNAEQKMNRLLYKNKSPEQPNVLFVKLADLMKYTNSLKTWSRKNSVWPMLFGLACCAIELMDFGAERIDAERKGYLLFRGTPRQCDVMIVAGWVTKSIAPRLRTLYEQMSSPKYVIAYGECATCGGPWFESYNIIHGIDQILPVDVYVAGCPPKPENLFQALINLQKKIGGETLGNSERSISPSLGRAQEKRI